MGRRRRIHPGAPEPLMLIGISNKRGDDSKDLVDLLGECHVRIRRFVDLAHEAAIRTDAPADQIGQACADVERYFIEALPLHVVDEEESIEPRLRGLSAEVDRALDVMTRQHEHHCRALAQLLRACAVVRAEPQDQGARDALEKVAKELQIDFEEHLTLEETVIFPAIRRLLLPETQALIISELRARRQPGASAKKQSATQKENES